jgi:tetratricopeptide (TPR) repeat protein
MRMTTLSVLFVLLTASAVSAQSVPVQDRASNGISLARQGNLADAERELRVAVSGAPSVAVYRAQLGSILGLQGKWNEALECFHKAVQLAPENLDFRRETAAVQWQLGVMPAAESNLQYVLEHHPGDPGAVLLLGLVKEKTGDYAKAAQLLDSQFELVAAEPERTVALFHSVVEIGQSDKITKIFDVLKLHADDRAWAGAISRCTQIAIMAEDLQTAEALFSLIPVDDSVQPTAGLQLAKLLYSHSQVPRAKELLLQLKSQGVENAALESLLGNCLESEREPEQAIAAYRRAIAADPSRIDLYEDLISILLYQHRTGDALFVANQALTVAPNDSRPWVWKGNVDLGRNASREAMDSYTHAVRLDNRNPDALFGIAGAYYVTGQGEAAISECRAGIAQFPRDTRFYISYAEMLLASPDAFRLHPQAKDLLEKALKLDPQSAQAHYLLGQIALQEWKLKEAEEDLLRSLASDPDRSKTHFALSRVYRRTERTDQAATEFALYEKLKEREESGGTTPLAMPEKQ